jgi:hypothetical protein
MTEAEHIVRIKSLLPTTLGSAEIRERIAADILARSVFSARMASESYLAEIRDVCAEVVAGRLSTAQARERLLRTLEAMGHSPQDEGGLKNPASLRRLDLIVNTQANMAASAARLMSQTPGTLEDFPAWELMRFEGRRMPRKDWRARWTLAGNSVGWAGALPMTPGGRMVALKSSPIWQALGDGAGGFRDTLGNPYPPFAYSSGLDWMDVSREEAERLGLKIPESQKIEMPSLAPAEEEEDA